MTDHIGPHEQYALVPPQTFVDRFAHHWTKQFDMPASEPLRKLWRIMANTYQQSIIATAQGQLTRWRVLRPPTGSGKTMGAVVYSGIQAELNASVTDGIQPVGIMIVTRLKAQVDEVVSDINAYVGRRAAIADHTDHRATPEQLNDSDIVVITHEAYTRANKTLSGVKAERWKRLTRWRGGQRLLTIVDEALANVVEHSQVKLDDLTFLIGLIPHELRLAHANEVQALKTLRDRMLAQADTNDGLKVGTSLIWAQGEAPVSANLTELRTAMRQLPYDRQIGKDDEKERLRLAIRYDKVLGAAEALLDQYALIAVSGNQHSLNSAALAVPLELPGPVVLDATAGVDLMYQLMEDRADIIPTPPGVRDYSNVTLHVARTASIGKTKMEELAAKRFPQLQANLNERLSSDCKVLFCVHKHVEHLVPTQADLGVTEVASAHWGAIDGSNDYKDFDTAVIFGLPFRDRIWGTGVFFAFQGVQPDDWHGNPTWKEHANVRELLQRRHLATSIIQAMGRVRLRKVVDEQGRCAPTEVFIVLPTGERGTEILRYIRKELPNVSVQDWPLDLDGPKVRVKRSGLPHEGLVTFMSNRSPGRTSMSLIGREFGLKPHQRKDLQKALRDEDHPTALRLKELGVTYGSEGKGRGAKSFLLKAA
ncbi:DEAD/DEAH box helicase family protein [Bradyrhizobium diazoefficiens]|uniref:Helicase ATP-binding domain-containing protein n=1 Tax=Bradyrhizobium diazoefficiens TaxID=1355477 RepID=A0A809XD15_9BRAD|nr:hypothetical protein XF1B_80180 [Bradyrhizobium diazoefficiens]BCE51596.1 hypothetical protein XF4B_79450 [Bradyrhizobium diazoefficiens]BCE95092.1 hypothetical protein XF10B_78900 [Bradyrhizobium diazoefficiens]BCF30038.1 hypothetical protein XF14B_79900 [Bradyrhizobium diazoefficiens]